MAAHEQGGDERYSFEAFTQHPFFTEVNRWIVERVICPGRRKVVDLGCGPGAVTKLILERLDDARNAKVIGIDPSASALSKARAAIHSRVVEFIEAAPSGYRADPRGAGRHRALLLVHRGRAPRGAARGGLERPG